MRLKLSPNGNLYIRDGRLLFGPEGECCCNDSCSLDEVPAIHPIECNETMDSVGGFTTLSSPAPLFVGSMQSPIFGSVSAEKDMSINPQTFTTVDIRHSSFISEITQDDSISSTTNVFYGDTSAILAYSVRHSNDNIGFNNSSGPRYLYSFQFGATAIGSPVVVDAETEIDFRGLLTINSRTFEETISGECIMTLEGTLEFFVDDELDQSATFSTQLDQGDINLLTNGYRLTADVRSASVPDDQGINSIQITVT